LFTTTRTLFRPGGPASTARATDPLAAEIYVVRLGFGRLVGYSENGELSLMGDCLKPRNISDSGQRLCQRSR